MAITAERESKRNSKPTLRFPENIQVKSVVLNASPWYKGERSPDNTQGRYSDTRSSTQDVSRDSRPRKSVVDKSADTATATHATVAVILSF